MKIKLNYSKSNEITYKQLCELNEFDNFTYNCSKNQMMMRLTTEQYEEALEALENGTDVEVLN